MKRILSILLLSLFVNAYIYSQCPVNAGNDRIVCESQAAVVLNGTPNGGTWSTTGAGFLDGPKGVYYFHASDIANGSVMLTYSYSGCVPMGDTSDNVIITITQAPIVDAGPNKTITGAVPVSLSGTISGTGTVFWSTNGTGTFSNPNSLNTIYTPSSADEVAGGVNLRLEGTSTTCSTTVLDEVYISITPDVDAVAGAFLDSTFNEAGPIKGKKQLDLTSLNDQAIDLVVDISGNVTVLGNSSAFGNSAGGPFFVSKLNSRGNLDLAFANAGSYIFEKPNPNVNYYAKSISRQPDGKILIAGYKDSLENRTGFILRLNSNGAFDNTFGALGMRYYKLSTNSLELYKIKALSDGRIIIAGKEISVGPFVARLRTNGALDNTFNGSGYYIESISEAIITGLDVKYNTNEVIYSVDYYSNGIKNTDIIKFRSDGTKDANFNGTGMYSFSVPFTTGNSAGVIFQPDGKILFGIADTCLAAYRLTQKGEPDTAFGDNGRATSSKMYGQCNNILSDGLGRIIITAMQDYSGYVAVRFRNNGDIDSSFALNGMYKDYVGMSASCYTSAITPDNKVIVAGSENSKYATVLRISNGMSWHLIGNQFVLPGTTEVYKAKAPASWDYNYVWEYTGSDYFFIPNSIGKEILIYFNDNATGGKLTCYGYSGKEVKVFQSIDITINTAASQAKLLAKVQCSPEVTDCNNNYISRFKLNQIDNDSSVCQSTGYSDYTRIGWMDTLGAGGVYSFQVNTESSDPLKYAAVWIDYNNDGFFDGNQEFVAATEGTGSTLNFQNVIIKNSEGYTGPKRLRVRCKPHPFTGNDACPTAGELGETEDYLVIINAQDELEAPQIITPNEDGKNDLFVIRGIRSIGENALTIFDRYGKTVYTVTHYENNWDGKDENGNKITPGTYYYYFQNEDNHIRGFLEIRY